MFPYQVVIADQYLIDFSISECRQTMSARSGFEEVLEIHSSLFNHKPFVESENRQFVK